MTELLYQTDAYLKEFIRRGSDIAGRATDYRYCFTASLEIGPVKRLPKSP
jgi:hypothetical protein